MQELVLNFRQSLLPQINDLLIKKTKANSLPINKPRLSLSRIFFFVLESHDENFSGKTDFLCIPLGLELLDSGANLHYRSDSESHTENILYGDRFYALGLTELVGYGKDYIKTVSNALNEISEAYTSKLDEIEDCIKASALWGAASTLAFMYIGKDANEDAGKIFRLMGALEMAADSKKTEIIHRINQKKKNVQIPVDEIIAELSGQ